MQRARPVILHPRAYWLEYIFLQPLYCSSAGCSPSAHENPHWSCSTRQHQTALIDYSQTGQSSQLDAKKRNQFSVLLDGGTSILRDQDRESPYPQTVLGVLRILSCITEIWIAIWWNIIVVFFTIYFCLTLPCYCQYSLGLMPCFPCALNEVTVAKTRRAPSAIVQNKGAAHASHLVELSARFDWC